MPVGETLRPLAASGGRAARRAAARAARMAGLLPRFDRRFGRGRMTWLKRQLPQTLYGRTLLIFVSAVVLTQAIVTFVFFDRQWDTTTSRLAKAVATDIALIVDLAEAERDPAARRALYQRAEDATGLRLTLDLDPVEPPVPVRPALLEQILAVRMEAELDRVLARPHAVRPGRQAGIILVEVNLGDGQVEIEVPVKRLDSGTTLIFLLWMGGSAAVLALIAMVFMRNEIRPIARLALAAERLGKGRAPPLLIPRGANEVRAATIAFQRMQERLQRQIRQRTILLAGISHDLRTPLTRLKLQLAMLGEQPELAGMAEDLLEMERLIALYLDFARGEGDEQPVPTDLTDLLRRLAEDTRRGGVDLQTRLPPEPVMLAVRPLALRRCVMNLLGNAARHGRRVWLSLQEQPEAVRIRVEDDGPGIPEAERERVFQPFTRLSEAERGTGTGLGLTIARDIVFSHGGEISLDESRFGGLRVTVLLPL